jgi:plasmid maintenance system antidote protein VapI
MGALALRIVRPLRPVTIEEITATPTFHGCLSLIAERSSLQDKTIAIEAEIDPGQLSKMFSGQSGIQDDKLSRLMDVCGSELPLFWLLHQRGYDTSSLRKRESELERQLREANELLARRDLELNTIKSFIRDTKSVAV